MGDLPRTIGTSKALVGYQIRLESKVSKGNILTFCTYVSKFYFFYVRKIYDYI